MVHSLRPVVREADEGGTWVGLLPDGPIMLLGGAGGTVLEVLDEAGGALASDRLVDAVLERFEDAPAEAPQEILRFIDELVEAGVLGRDRSDEERTQSEGTQEMRPPEQSMVVRVAGEEVELVFAVGLEGLASRARVLWSHLLVEDEPAPTSAGASAARIRRRYVPGGAPDAPTSDESAGDGGDRAGADVPHPEDPAVQRVLPTGAEGAYALSGDITRALIERLRGRRLLLHAAAVERPKTGVVLLVGPSGAGKSTAAQSLARGGAYLTDELTIVMPQDLSVSAYPKPLSRVDQGAARWTKRDHALPALGLEFAPRAEPPSHVVILDRVDEAGEPGDPAHPPRLERVPLREALSVLIAQSSSLWMVPDGLSVLAAVLERTGGALRATYREADELTGLLARLPAPAPESTVAIPPPEPFAVPGPGEWAVAPFLQALAMDDGVQVLCEGRAVHAPGLSGLIWEELVEEGPGSLDSIVQRIQVHLGPHPDSRELVEASLGMLVAQRCVRRG